MTLLEMENLLKETDFLYCDDVKDLVENLDEFTAYRKKIRKYRVFYKNANFVPPTKPTIMWDYDKVSE